MRPFRESTRRNTDEIENAPSMHRLSISSPLPEVAARPWPFRRAGVYFFWDGVDQGGWTVVVDKAIDQGTGTSMDDARVELFPQSV